VETGCAVALQAIAAGAVPVTSSRTALPEVVGEGGVQVPGSPAVTGFAEGLADLVSGLLADPERLASFRARGAARDLEWDGVPGRIAGAVGNKF